MADVDISVVPP
jgi:hypothetical protein